MAPTQSRDNPANLFMFMCFFFPWLLDPGAKGLLVRCKRGFGRCKRPLGDLGSLLGPPSCKHFREFLGSGSLPASKRPFAPSRNHFWGISPFSPRWLGLQDKKENRLDSPKKDQGTFVSDLPCLPNTLPFWLLRLTKHLPCWAELWLVGKSQMGGKTYPAILGGGGQRTIECPFQNHFFLEASESGICLVCARFL